MQKQELHDARRHMQMVFQDPFASLDPQMRLIDQVAEPMQNYKTLGEDEMNRRVEMLFDRVKLPRSFLRRYPMNCQAASARGWPLPARWR